jgi:hypothetical protein
MDETSSTISPNSFIMKLPSALTPVMLEYVQSIGLYELFSACIASPCWSFSNSIVQCRQHWNVRHSKKNPICIGLAHLMTKLIPICCTI